jgi:hypothetical protein
MLIVFLGRYGYDTGNPNCAKLDAVGNVNLFPQRENVCASITVVNGSHNTFFRIKSPRGESQTTLSPPTPLITQRPEFRCVGISELAVSFGIELRYIIDISMPFFPMQLVLLRYQ